MTNSRLFIINTLEFVYYIRIRILFDNLSDKMSSTNEETDFVEEVQMVVEVIFELSIDIVVEVIFT